MTRTAERQDLRCTVHFMHIGKTGGSALKYALRDTPSTDRYDLVLHDHLFSLADAAPGEKVIFFLRDPVTRFVSGFHSRQRCGDPRRPCPWTTQETVAFERFHTPNELALALRAEGERDREAAIHAMQNIYHVKGSFWRWFGSETYFLSRAADILFIGFQERLDEDFQSLKKILQLPESLQLPMDELDAHVAPAEMDTHLDAEAIKSLEAWYKDDYRFLDLCKQWLDRHRAAALA